MNGADVFADVNPVRQWQSVLGVAGRKGLLLLYAAVLDGAVAALQHRAQGVRALNPFEADEARAWVASLERDGWRLSFEGVTEALGLDASAIRRKLQIVPEEGIDRRPWAAQTPSALTIARRERDRGRLERREARYARRLLERAAP